MLVSCKTDANGHSGAVFEVADRKEATIIRKQLYSLLPRNCHSSVRASASTKQCYLDWRHEITKQAGLPLGPIKWFASGDKLPERFEDLLVPPEAMQAFWEERQAALRRKPLSYWILPDIPFKGAIHLPLSSWIPPISFKDALHLIWMLLNRKFGKPSV